MARVVAAHLAASISDLIARTKGREDCSNCDNARILKCTVCDETGFAEEDRPSVKAWNSIVPFIGPMPLALCENCEGKGKYRCDDCDTDEWEIAVIRILDLDVRAEDVLDAVRQQPDVFTLCVDAGRLWLPRTPGIAPFVAAEERQTIVWAAYDTRQLPLI